MSTNADSPTIPTVVGRASFQAELDALRAREKAHTRQGDEIAAARRRLPMVEVDPALQLLGPAGPVTLGDTFEGRRQLIVYYFMWNPGRPASEQCEGCTFFTSQLVELSGLHSRDITYAVFSQGRNVDAGCADAQTSCDEKHRLPRLPGLDDAMVFRAAIPGRAARSAANSACSTWCAISRR